MASAAVAAQDELGWGRRAIFCVIALNLSGLLLFLSAQLIGPSVYWLQDWAAPNSPYALVKVTLSFVQYNSLLPCTSKSSDQIHRQTLESQCRCGFIFYTGEIALWGRAKWCSLRASGNLGKSASVRRYFKWKSDSVRTACSSTLTCHFCQIPSQQCRFIKMVTKWCLDSHKLNFSSGC